MLEDRVNGASDSARASCRIRAPLSGEGDVGSISLGAKHLHRADATIAMIEVAVQEEVDGKAVQCVETGAIVTDSSEGRQR